MYGVNVVKTKPVQSEDRRFPFIPVPSRETSFQQLTHIVSLRSSPSRGPISEDWKGKFVGLFKRHFLPLEPFPSPPILDRLLLFPNDELCAPPRIRCDARKLSTAEEGNEIEITPRFESWFAQFRPISPDRQRERGVGEEETIYASGRPSIYAVSLESNSWLPRGMLERYVDGRIRAIPSFARNTAAE